MDTQGYEDDYGEQYQLQDQGAYDGDGAGYVLYPNIRHIACVADITLP